MNNEDGLPEVAKKHVKKNPVIWIMFGIVILAFLSMYFFTKSHKKNYKPVEENYSFQSKESINSVKAIDMNKKSEPEPTKVTPTITQEQIELIRAKQNELQQRLSAPLMLVNNGQQNKIEAQPQTNFQSNDRNTEFLHQIASNNVETTSANTLGPLNCIIAEGSLIHGILEPAKNSDLPGYVRAIVSEPMYSEDGTQILIPAGSRLIGQYKSGILQGQSRIFMFWTRLITPKGISIQIGSPGVDSLGVAGIEADQVDRHFWQRFGTASLLSIIGMGASNAGMSYNDKDNSASSYRTALTNSFSQSAEQSLQQDGKISPTLTTYQGKPIIVFVAKDINFQAAMNKTKQIINIL